MSDKETNISNYLDKLKDMADIRDDFNTIDVNKFLLPTMGEMVQEDLMSEILENFMENEDYKEQEQGILDESYYTETPFTTSLGYHPQESVFMLKARKLSEDETSWLFNKIDGDTTYFKIDDIDDGNQPFTFTNRMSYGSFKEYYKQMNGSSALTIRHLGLNCPELPHIEVQVVSETSKNKMWEEIEMPLKDVKALAKKNVSVKYLKYPMEDESKSKIKERKDTDPVKLLKMIDDDGKEIYKEILDDSLLPGVSNLIATKFKASTDSNGEKVYNYYPIVAEDDSTAKGIIDAYNCQKKVKEVLSNASEILLMINANGINFGRTVGTTQMVFNSLFYADDTIKFMVKQWETSFENVPETSYTYRPYGTDTYTRSLGVVYVKQVKDGETRWINLNKMVLAGSTESEVNPSYTSSPELESIGAGISDIFKLWSYDKDNLLYIDSFSNLTKNSYNERLELHKKLTGIDFTQTRNCSLMIGDTLMLVPPESIRNITQVFYERIPNLRSKGTMTKQVGQNEQMLELTLYFYEDAGINGIKHNITTPSGEKLTYYMNGLRSLIAQFKLTPFLPIENGYINDVLGIEAVSMQNIYIQSVEGFPRLLKVVLTLREFNYRTFMPDLPVTEDDNETISELTPMFAKCFNWEIFRYYYQRSIMAGEVLNNLNFGTYDYNLQFYGHKNTLERFDFCSPPGMGSNISFYIPDEVWLKNALQIKKEREAALYTDKSYVDLSTNAQNFLLQLKALYDRLQIVNNFDDEHNQFKNKLKEIFDYQELVYMKIPSYTKLEIIDDYTENMSNGDIVAQKCIANYNITENKGDETFVYIMWDKDGNVALSKDEVNKKIKEAKNLFSDQINDTGYMNGLKMNEFIYWNTTSQTYDVCWDFVISLNTSSLTDDDLSNIKEVLMKNAASDNSHFTLENIFRNNSIRIRYVSKFNPPIGENLPTDIGSSFRLNQAICQLFTESDYSLGISFQGNDLDYKALEQIQSIVTTENEDGETEVDISSNANNKAIDFYVKDYKNPANMPFVPFLENIPISAISGNMSNTFTEISLKAIEGVGPQYLGGQDTTIEIQIITDDIVAVSMLNSLPTMASALAKQYRKILPSWPLKIRSEFTGLISVSEVLIDAIEVDTVDGFPGVYSISMRLTSVDRTQRQREALRRLDLAPVGGNVSASSSNLAINKYFAIESYLSQAELYPDLDLPTIDEMAKLGWKFIKYTGNNRMYPDPDFYITYAYPYSSLIIKKTIKDVLSKQLLSTDGEENLQSFKFSDVMGASVTAKVEALLGLSEQDENSVAQTYREILDQHKENAKEKWQDANNKNSVDVDKLGQTIEDLEILNHLLMCDIQDGWELKPGFKAPLCDPSTNDAILKSQSNVEKNAYADDIVFKRKTAIELIDAILEQPLDYREDIASMEKLAPSDYQTPCEIAVNKLFLDNPNGKKLLELLCPSMTLTRLTGDYQTANNNYTGMKALSTTYAKKFNEKYFKDINPIAYLAGFAFASGCSLSGSEQYKTDVQVSRWHPNHYISGEDLSKPVEAQDQPGVIMPYIEYERLAGRSSYAEELGVGIQLGTTFGAWRISKYEADEISSMMIREDRSIKYTDNDEIYKNKNKNIKTPYVQGGYIDPYYNALDPKKDEKELEKYQKSIAVNKEANVEAFLRIVLTYLKKMILDGLIFSEIDIVINEFSYFCDKYGGSGVINSGADAITMFTKPPTITSDATDELNALGINQEDIDQLLFQINNSFGKSFCARLIYPFLLAVSSSDPKVYNILKSRDINALNNLTGYVENSSQSTETTGKIYKFLSALAGSGMTLSSSNSNEATASLSQQVMNNMMKDVYIQAAEDPRCYLLHSFYDMLVNDKRGRLVRAFPTYYFMLIDEGRKIGSWKLHDNFYNMNAISEIQIVKSRKIAADTCSITMSNMFNSYTTESDLSTTQQYLDLYGMKDVFYSIFSPESYFEKEKSLRLRQEVPDKVQLQPGVRIHVRMGYTADGSKLPVLFNGKIAEVETGDVAQIIAQGDGHELMNPLNAFGEMEVTSLEPAQTSCTWFKDLRGSLARGGETPRDLLAKLLTAKYGGWKKVTNDVFDGRWFNDNPFGVMHFGDPKYNHIFSLGEPVQNLYEVSDTTLLNGTNELWSSENAKKSTPIINTSLQDKTLWDILHLCANSGLNYIGAVRDFGFRSTVFLGKPNHYYAYDYALVDNKVVERRKPFQQFHYYDSYNDIIYNSIKASEAQMKTNAVGLWQASSPWWGREQATVGPIYLDMNIYPEYQKSMTVDTGLLADGNGGIDIPFITHFSEKWAMNPNDDKVNKALAWRVTANTLRDSVKDMYLGDVGIIGDPSVKPHDRVYIYDTYEDIQGMFEVEAVVHTMSVQNGFTTSIMPDVIARHQDEMEAANQGLLNNVGATLKGVVTSNIIYNLFTVSFNNKLAVTLAKSKTMYGATTKLIEHSKNLANAAGMLDYLDNHPVAQKLFNSLNFIPSQTNLDLNKFTSIVELVANYKPGNNMHSDLLKFAKTFETWRGFDPDEFANTMMKVYESSQYGAAGNQTQESIKEAIKEMKSTYTSLQSKLEPSLNKIDLHKFAEDINKASSIKDKIINKETKEVLEYLAANGPDLDSKTKAKYFSTLINDDVISDAVKNKKIVVEGIDEFREAFIKMVTDPDTGLNAAKIKAALRGGNVIDDLLSVVLRFAKFNWASILIDIALTVTIEVFIRNTKEMFTRWLQSVQAVDVYPLKRNGKPLIAGMNGHKGSVAMYPVNDGFNSIQGMILDAVEAVDNISLFKMPVGSVLMNTFLVDRDILNQLSTDWRYKLGLIDPDVDDTSASPEYDLNREDIYQNIYGEISSSYSNRAKTAQSLQVRKRVKDMNDSTDKEAQASQQYYKIKDVNPVDMANNDNVKKLYYIERDDTLQKAIADEKLIIAHNEAYTSFLKVPFESGYERVPIVTVQPKNKSSQVILDTPLVQEEVIYILKRLVVNESLTGKIHFKSGARLNDNGWNSTGFRFILDYQGKDKKLKEALEELREQTSYKETSDQIRYFFEFEEHKSSSDKVEDYKDGWLDFNHKYIIVVNAPTCNTESEKSNNNKGEKDE